MRVWKWYGLAGVGLVVLLGGNGGARASNVIALGVEPRAEGDDPPIVLGEDPRFGMAFSGTVDGTGGVLYGGGSGEDAVAEADTWAWDGTSWTSVCGTEETPLACGPGPRAFHAMAPGPTGVVLYGGTRTAIDDDDGNALGDTYLFDGETWQQVCAECPPGARQAASIASDGTRVVLFGGFDRGAPPTNDTWMFDGAQWVAVHTGGAAAPPARFGAQFAWDGERFVLFGGGRVPQAGELDVPEALDDTWTFDGSTWEKVCGEDDPCGPRPRFIAGFDFLDHADPNRRGALLVGGLLLRPSETDTLDPGVEDDLPEFLADIWFWDGIEWIALGSPWTGGALDDDVEVFPSLPVFPAIAGRPVACAVDLVASFPTGLPTRTTRSLRSGTVTLGFDAGRDGLPDPCPVEPVAELPVLPLAYEEFGTPVPVLFDGESPRAFAGFAALPSGDGAVFYGGIFLDGEGVAESDTWIWDGEAWRPQCGTDVGGATAPCGPGPRSLHGMAAGPDGPLLYGGADAAGPEFDLKPGLADTFEWNGTRWVEICSQCPPGSRWGAAMAGNGESVLLFGGMIADETVANDTWLFDGEHWTLLDPGGEDGPVARLGGQLAWDGMHYVLFSGLGLDASGEPSVSVGTDTWIWDETEWVRMCTGDACGPRYRAGAPFMHLSSVDPWRRGALLVGGTDFTIGEGDYEFLGDVWLWDGSVWIKLASPWVDWIVTDRQGQIELPMFGAAAARPRSCEVSLTASVPLGADFDRAVPMNRTWNIGFDSNRDGVPDPCLPEPSPSPVPTPSPTASAPPAPTRTPPVRTERRSIGSGGHRRLPVRAMR